MKIRLAYREIVTTLIGVLAGAFFFYGLSSLYETGKINFSLILEPVYKWFFFLLIGFFILFIRNLKKNRNDSSNLAKE